MDLSHNSIAKHLNGFYISDGDSKYLLKDLGGWAVFAFQLGYNSFQFNDVTNRTFSLVSVPCRETFLAICTLGAVVSDAVHWGESESLTWGELKEVEEGKVIYFLDRGKICRGELGGFDKELGARKIHSKRSITHYINENNFSDYHPQFDVLKKSSSSYQTQLLEFLQEAFGLDERLGWLRTTFPKIVLNTVKTNFITTVNQLELCWGDKCLPFSELLRISDGKKLGSNKLLLKSEKPLENSYRPKLAILATPKFQNIIRDYSYSNILVIVEHQEYNEEMASFLLRISSLGLDQTDYVNEEYNLHHGVKLFSKALPRNS